MPKQQTDPNAPRVSPWTVSTWYTLEVENRSPSRDRVPTVEESYAKVHTTESEAHAWDLYRALAEGEWVPAEATSWGVSEPWKR